MEIEEIAQQNELILHQIERDNMPEESRTISAEKREDNPCVSKEGQPEATVT